MIPTTDKLEEVNADLWGPHDPLFQPSSKYAVILMCEYTQKSWTLYLQRKNNFIDAFHAWLFRAKAEFGCLMKILRVDGREEFILHRVQTFCEKRDILIKYATLKKIDWPNEDSVKMSS